jgi:VanZ family protein
MNWILRWGPALLLMAVIFAFSARPSNELPDFGGWDYFVKKTAHAIEYGLLALAFWRGFGMHRGRKWLAWGLAFCYAITDEFHQAFVPGRIPSPVDVLVFDNLGAILSVNLLDKFGRRSRPMGSTDTHGSL